MRICLVTHGFPPLDRTGVENYTAALAVELVAAGHVVEVFVPRVAAELPDLSLRREERDGFGVTWVTTRGASRNQEEELDPPGIATAFGEFLDVERPEIVHFQHVIKLGVGLIFEASTRGLPTIYTAHDYYSICHRFTLLRPDLERCETIGDSELCARCDLGVSFLNTLPELGQYQLGALPEQLDAEARQALAGILAGDPDAAGNTDEELAGFVERRTKLDARRLEAFQELDWIVSPTRFLADRLIEGGLDSEKIEILTYGAETDGLSKVTAARCSATTPLRFGYLGGLSKHKGIHVLVDAFEALDEPAELLIWGDSSDLAYVQTLRSKAEQVGAQWRGSYRRDELAACLGEVDVVVVPSTWVENYPFVIREAFAAGRPVIVSDVGALSESVRPEVDGLSFAPGDAKALSRAMARLITEDGLHAKLVRGIEPVKSITTQVAELTRIYARLIEARTTDDSSSLLDSLRQSNQRFTELASLPSRELFRRVLDGLGVVDSLLTESPRDSQSKHVADLSLSARALASTSSTQVLIRDLVRERDWLTDSIRSHESTVVALRKRLAWREDELGAHIDRNEWLRENAAATKQSVDSLSEENQSLAENISETKQSAEALLEENTWLRRSIADANRNLQALSDEIAALTESTRWLRKGNEDATKSITSLTAENEWLKTTIAAKDDEKEALKTTLAARDAESEWLKTNVEAKSDESGWLKTHLDARDAEIVWLKSTLAGRDEEADWLKTSITAKDEEILSLNATVSANAEELSRLRESVAEHELASSDRADQVEQMSASLRASATALSKQREVQRTLQDSRRDLKLEVAALDERSRLESERLHGELQALGRFAAKALEPQREVLGSELDSIIERLENQPSRSSLDEYSNVVRGGNRKISALIEELVRRREQMRTAAELADRRIARLVIRRTGLGRAVASWESTNHSGTSDGRSKADEESSQ